MLVLVNILFNTVLNLYIITNTHCLYIALKLRKFNIVNNRDYLRDCVYLCLSDETVKAIGPFYLVSMPGEVKYPTHGVNV